MTLRKRPGQQKRPRVGVRIMMVSPLVYWAPVAKKTRKEIPKFGGTKSDTEKFGSLKAVLEKIPALCADRTVRSQSPT